jgi:bifunctional non-homologous end joining protein LigD
VRHFDGHGAEVFEKACALGAPAVLARRRDKPHGEPARRIECKTARLTKPDKMLWRAAGVTKRALAEYYAAIGEHIVPHVAGRPLTLVRANDAVEDGVAYLRHSKAWGPAALRRVSIAEKTKVGEYLIADDLPAVLGLVQMSIVEIHTWNVTYPDVERPDRLVLDLDPDPSVAWDRVIDAARLLRSRLEALGHASFVKTTGGKGLHVVVPLVPRAEWDEVLRFARAFSESIVRDDPRGFTTAMPKERRRGKILIDYLRNNRTNTSVAAFSTRAHPSAPVSMPVAWEQLSRVDPTAFTPFTVPKLLARRRRDPWRDYEEVRRPLTSRSAISATRMSSSGESPTRRRSRA